MKTSHKIIIKGTVQGVGFRSIYIWFG